MGQKVGKASFDDAAAPFLNLPAPAVSRLWRSFNLSAETWGLSVAPFVSICAELAKDLGLTDLEMRAKSEALFALLDTDNNGIIDALEFMSLIAMVSAMEPADKVGFIYTVYDFSESGELLIDEITLAVKSTASGLCKVSKLQSPKLKEFEDLARLAFASVEKPADKKLSAAEFLGYCRANPTASSWVSHYDDIPDAAGTMDLPEPGATFALPAAPSRTEKEALLLAGLPVDSAGASSWFADKPCLAPMEELLKPEEPTAPITTAPDSQVHGTAL
jgi:Ca2+-binding EF-hand superfamily protein